MTEKLKSIRDLADTQSEILAWTFIVLAVGFELRGFEDLYTLGMLALAAGIMGYVQKVKAGQAEFDVGPRDE